MATTATTEKKKAKTLEELYGTTPAHRNSGTVVQSTGAANAPAASPLSNYATKEGEASIQARAAAANPSAPAAANSPSATPSVETESNTQASAASASQSNQGFKQDFGLSYEGDSFTDWYQKLYGTAYNPQTGLQRQEGISDADWNYGNTLYNYYQREQNLTNSNTTVKDQLEQNYLDSVNALEASKRQSQQEASIMYDKLQKYLPQQIQAQGLGGLGVSESAMLKAQSQYSNTMTDISNSYNENKATLDANKQSNLTDLELAYMENKTNLDISKREDLQATYDKEKDAYYAKTDEQYAEIRSIIESSKMSTEELQEYLQSQKGSLTEDKYNILMQVAQNVGSANLENKQDEAFSMVEGLINSSNYMTSDEMNALIDQHINDLNAEDVEYLRNYAANIANQNKETYNNEQYNLGVGAIDDSMFTSVDEMVAFINENYAGKVSDVQLQHLINHGTAVANKNLKAEQTEQWNNAIEDIGTSGYTSIEEMASILQFYKGKVSDADYSRLEQQAKFAAKANAATASAEVASAVEGILANNVNLKTEEELTNALAPYKEKLTDRDYSLLLDYGKSIISQNIEAEEARQQQIVDALKENYGEIIPNEQITDVDINEDLKTELKEANESAVKGMFDGLLTSATSKDDLQEATSGFQEAMQVLVDYKDELTQATKGSLFDTLFTKIKDMIGVGDITTSTELANLEKAIYYVDEAKRFGLITDTEYAAYLSDINTDQDNAELTVYKSTQSSGLIQAASSATIKFAGLDDKVTITLGTSKSSIDLSGNTLVKDAEYGQAFLYKGIPYVKDNAGKLQKVMNYWGDGAYEKLIEYLTGTVYDIKG